LGVHDIIKHIDKKLSYCRTIAWYAAH